MENQDNKPVTETGSSTKEQMQEVGSNLTGTARPAMPDEKEFISHHTNKNAPHAKTINTDALLGNVNPDH